MVRVSLCAWSVALALLPAGAFRSNACLAATQPLSPEEAAMLVLNSARRAYNEEKYDFAAERFRDFLKQYAGHKQTPSASYGLALCLLEGPQKDYPEAVKALHPVVAAEQFSERPYALYYLGAALRGVGRQALAQIEAKPGEAAALRAAAVQSFDQAAKYFGDAGAAFSARAAPPAPPKPAPTTAPTTPAPPPPAPTTATTTPAPPPPAPTTATTKPVPPPPAPTTATTNPAPPPPVPPPPAPPPPAPPPPPDAPILLEWSARARCDQAEMLLQAGKYKPTIDAAAALLGDAAMAKSRYRPLATYHMGYAQFALKDYLQAGKTLSQLAPFQQEFGLHVRYLLARVHHLSNQRPEAALQYKTLTGEYDARMQAAKQALKNPGALKPEQRAALQAVVSQPAPEYVLRAAFYYGLVLAEDGRYGEAIERLNPLIQQNPKFALVGEAQLRIGFCQMQSRNYAEATKVLQPLREHPQLGDRATWWLGRIQVAGADPANPAAVEQAAKAAVETIRQGLEKCKAAAQTDPDAKTRKGDITLELADTMQLAKQYKEAIQAYQQVVDEGGDRTEEAMQRQVTAMHMGGQYKESDDLAAKFQQKYPKSTLMPAVLFRMAENAYLTAGAAFANPALPNRQQELEKLYGEAIARYQRLLKEFPEFPSTNLARQGMATAYYRLGKYAEAITALQGIAEADRLGELASVPYVLADCILRTLPPEADDALGAAELVAQIDKAVKLLEGFVGGQGAKPQPPDAMLKLAHCYRRMGAQLASPTERQKFLNSAREVCDKARQLYPQDASMGLFLLERARAQASQGDFGGAMGELGRFRSDPLKASPAAPLGLVRLSSLLRAQGRAPEAVQLMQEVRTAHEAAMAKDPARADWVAAVQYEQALAVKETGKVAEARAMFEALAKAFPGRPEAVNALWRAGQCVREESVAKLAAAEGAGAKPGASAQEVAATGAAIAECLKSLQQTAEGFVAQAGELAKTAQTKPASLRVLYEAAWCYRAMADSEINAARQKLARQTLEKVARNLATQPAATSQPALAPPEVPLASIPVQPSEKLTQGLYDRLIAAAPESPLANQARFELAELLSRRGSYDAAQELLAAAMERSPSPEMAERIRVRLASSLLAQNNIKEATNQLGIVLKNPRSPAAAEAQYLMGETYILQKDWNKAVEQLLVFRDQAPFLYRRGISDRALHRLGYAYGQLGNWDASRSALRVIVERFPNSPVADEARYGIGWASQMLKQPDQAIAAYAEVTHRTAGEVAARAQFQIGLCRLEQNNHVEAAKALLVVPYTYDYPELSAAAWCEAGRAYAQMRQPAEAVKAWQRTIQDYPQSQWAKIAQQRLAELK